VVGRSVFLGNVYRHGLLDLDDQTYWERTEDMRRGKATESGA